MLLINENKKYRVPYTYYTNNDYANIYKVYEDHITFDLEQAKKTKSGEKQKTSFSKKLVENSDLLRINPYWTK